MKKYKMTLTFDSVYAAHSVFCRYMDTHCEVCPIHDICDAMYSEPNPDIENKAAELMGLETVEVTELTEAELAICKVLGAKWVSRDDEGYEHTGVRLWTEKPQKENRPYYHTTVGKYIAFCELGCFPSLKAGDCVNVEELLKDERKKRICYRAG